MVHSDLTAASLREALNYNPLTGIFTWRSDRRAGRNYNVVHSRAGAVAGTPKSGYVVIFLFGAQYRAHRLAWLHSHGVWPSQDIDHVNGCRSDNRLDNLREATRAQNNYNAKRRADNRSGFKGVHFDKARDAWGASIRRAGKSRTLGRFSTPEAAHAAYVVAASEYAGEFARLA